MDNDNKDTIDLIPYYKLIKRTISGINSWFGKNLVFILIVFIALTGFKLYKHVYGGNKFLYNGVIDREYISNDDLSGVLKSTARKIKVLNESESRDVKLDPENLLVQLYKLEYKIVLGLKDEVVNNSNRKIDSLQIDYDVPMNVSLYSYGLLDSIGEKFINYLNSHPYVLKLREEHLFLWDKRMKELRDKINFIDTIIDNTLAGNETSDVQRDYLNIDHGNEVYHLVKYKNELILELTNLEINLEKSKNADFFIVDGFKGAEKIERIDFSSILFYLKYLVYSCLIVLFISPFLNRLLRR